MGWMQQAPEQITYTEVEVVLPPPVKKQVWDRETQSFVPMTLYRCTGVPTLDKLNWLSNTFGVEGTYKNGQFWDYSLAGNFMVMDEKVYTWYQMKWGGK